MADAARRSERFLQHEGLGAVIGRAVRYHGDPPLQEMVPETSAMYGPDENVPSGTLGGLRPAVVRAGEKLRGKP
jgi:hypothetical protein